MFRNMGIFMHKTNRIIAFAKLTRIEHSLMLVIAVIAAEIILGMGISLYIFLLALIPPVFVSMGAFAINDYFDVEVDRRNKKFDRPLVNKSLTKRSAFIISILTLLIGVTASILINVYAFMITLIFAVLAYLYSYKLKEVLLAGNAYITLAMVIPFIYGNFVVSKILNWNILLISILIFLSGFAREIHGMVRDFDGDVKVRKIKNIVYYIGKRNSNIIALILYIEAVLISLFMFFFMPPFAHNLVYISLILIVDIVLLYNGLIYFRKNSQKYFRLSRNISLAAMGFAIIVYIISSIIYVVV